MGLHDNAPGGDHRRDHRVAAPPDQGTRNHHGECDRRACLGTQLGGQPEGVQINQREHRQRERQHLVGTARQTGASEPGHPRERADHPANVARPSNCDLIPKNEINPREPSARPPISPARTTEDAVPTG